MKDEKTSKYPFPEVYVRLSERSVLYSDQPVNTPKKATEVMAKVLAGMDREYLCVVNLDTQLHPINYNVVSIGGLNTAPASMSNIYKSAILANASALIVLHNHPSGVLEPSREDIEVTRKIEEASKLMDIRLLDHVIVAGRTGAMYSFQEHGLMMGGPSNTELLGEKSDSYNYEKKKQLQEITEKLESGIRELQSSEAYRHYLDVMGRFHHYSMSNCILIAMQNPEARLVAGYAAWEKKFGRHVKRGEKGIKIIAPAPYSVSKQRTKTDPLTGKILLNQNGKPQKEMVDVMVPNFKVTTVFDVKQTEGKELPHLVHELKADVNNYQQIMSAIRKISPVPIEFSDMPGSTAKGYYDQVEKKIVIRDGMSGVQTIKTAAHELSHALLHDKDTGSQKDQMLDRRVKEVEAESVAYVVCQHFGIDTSDYSFAYVESWSRDQELSDLKASLNVIQKTAGKIIDGIEEKCKEHDRSQVETMVQKLAEQLSLDSSQSKTIGRSHGRCR